MHELAVTESILETAVRYAEKAGAVRITNLYLVVGELSSIVNDSVQFYWDFIAKGTMAEGAVLHFHRIPAQMRCRDCQATYSPKSNLACPNCASSRVQIVAGEEFSLEAIDVEHEQDAPKTRHNEASPPAASRAASSRGQDAAS